MKVEKVYFIQDSLGCPSQTLSFWTDCCVVATTPKNHAVNLHETSGGRGVVEWLELDQKPVVQVVPRGRWSNMGNIENLKNESEHINVHEQIYVHVHADSKKAGSDSSPEYLISDLDLIGFGDGEPEPENPGTSKEALKPLEIIYPKNKPESSKNESKEIQSSPSGKFALGSVQFPKLIQVSKQGEKGALFTLEIKARRKRSSDYPCDLGTKDMLCPENIYTRCLLSNDPAIFLSDDFLWYYKINCVISYCPFTCFIRPIYTKNRGISQYYTLKNWEVLENKTKSWVCNHDKLSAVIKDDLEIQALAQKKSKLEENESDDTSIERIETDRTAVSKELNTAVTVTKFSKPPILSFSELPLGLKPSGNFAPGSIQFPKVCDVLRRRDRNKFECVFWIESQNLFKEKLITKCSINNQCTNPKFPQIPILRLKCLGRSKMTGQCPFVCSARPVFTTDKEDPKYFCDENWAMIENSTAEHHGCIRYSLPKLISMNHFPEKTFKFTIDYYGVERRVKLENFWTDKEMLLRSVFRLQCAHDTGCKFTMQVRALKTKCPDDTEFFTLENWEVVEAGNPLTGEFFVHSCLDKNVKFGPKFLGKNLELGHIPSSETKTTFNRICPVESLNRSPGQFQLNSNKLAAKNSGGKELAPVESYSTENATVNSHYRPALRKPNPSLALPFENCETCKIEYPYLGKWRRTRLSCQSCTKFVCKKEHSVPVFFCHECVSKSPLLKDSLSSDSTKNMQDPEEKPFKYCEICQAEYANGTYMGRKTSYRCFTCKKAICKIEHSVKTVFCLQCAPK